jgi:enterochelin esterase-like enzyme
MIKRVGIAALLFACFPAASSVANQRQDAPPEPPAFRAVDGSIHVEQIESRYLHERRTILVYVPAGASHAPLPVIYLADGLAPQVGPVIHALAEAGLAREAIIVGISPGPAFDRPPTEEMFRQHGELRAQEYLLDYPHGKTRFAAHEQFLLQEVLPLIEKKWGASTDRRERAVMGQSNGAAWALFMASRHPDLFSTVIALSFGWKPTLAQLRKGGAIERLYLSVGTQEPPLFPVRSRQAVDILASRAKWLRYDVSPEQHGQAAWDQRYRDALTWAFPTTETK